ncbi:ANTAR domain-containing protein [Mycolicibacterium arenosum]|uniref:ANTAR domain-containing protein n=1 Tax=Mycolicibacterium arenosum TaxID=2952157 RepID=A0ABT1MCC5_9MYCO|nr:ANTAR domain-containing protein [Mycolicibacterium sp. CAU 1645]MCP9276801.1 ANTAR domain-containing protein [Mycolicibacterium sp. CAU 1645]
MAARTDDAAREARGGRSPAAELEAVRAVRGRGAAPALAGLDDLADAPLHHGISSYVDMTSAPTPGRPAHGDRRRRVARRRRNALRDARFHVDLLAMVLREKERITENVAVMSSRRAGIEQAEGALTVIYGIAPEAAFKILRWRSQQTTTTLRALAVQLVADFQSLDAENGPPSRAVCDRLVMTVHERTPR